MDGKSISEAMHDIAKDLHEIGHISDEQMREFDIKCRRPPARYTPTQIKRIREKTTSSQSIFASCLNVSTDTVRRWERGQSQPQGPALRVLSVLDQKGLSALV